MEIIIKGEAKEIAGLALAAQNQITETERDALLRWYEFNLAELRSGDCPNIRHSERASLIQQHKNRMAVLKNGGLPSEVISMQNCTPESESTEDGSDSKGRPGAAAQETVTAKTNAAQPVTYIDAAIMLKGDKEINQYLAAGWKIAHIFPGEARMMLVRIAKNQF